MPRDAAFARWLEARGFAERMTPQEELFLYRVFCAESPGTEATAVLPSIADTPPAAPPFWEIRAAAVPASATSPTAEPARTADARAADAMTIQGRCTLPPIAAADAAAGKKQRRFEIVGYTGEPMQLGWWDYPVVIDLAGIDAGDGILPILDNHGPRPFSDESARSYFIGQSETAAVENGQFVLRGIFFEVTDAAKEILALADAGAKFQASIGARALQRDFIAEGNSVEVNGRSFDGPIYVARRTKVRETSIVVNGADGDTSVIVARSNASRGNAQRDNAQRDNRPSRSTPMKKAATFAEYLQARSIDEASLTKPARAALQAAYDADTARAAAKAARIAARNAIPPTTPPIAQPVDIKAYRAEMAAETTRIRTITDLTASNPALTAEVVIDGKPQTVNIREHAIAAGWDRGQVESTFALADLRAQRAQPSPHFYMPTQPNLSGPVLEAAILQAGRCDLWDETRYDREGVPARIKRETLADLNARYTDQVQQAAHTMFRGHIGLQQLLCTAAASNGKAVPHVIRDNLDLELVLRACNWDIRAEGGSTISLQNTLANVMNKFLLAGYLFAENTYRDICAVRPTKDFKPTKSVNIFGDFVYKKVNADGQLQAATLTDEAFANQVDTFGRLLSVPRQTIINDDLAALTTIPQLMGVGAIDLVNLLVWTLWLTPGNGPDGNAFWFARNVAANQLGGGAAQSNLITGATSVLSSAALQLGKQTYDKQVKPNGQPLGFEAEILLHPPELDQVATELMVSDLLVGTGQTANSRQPATNIMKGRYKRAMSRYLSNPTIPGFSATAWWLLANPGRAAAIELAFLNGQETPTVQTAQADFDRLGIMVRGFFDVGANMQNIRAGLKSNGA